MKIVFSRKGFDSAAGGCASPILPDGRMVSLPIPTSQVGPTLNDLVFDGVNLGTLARQLHGERGCAKKFCHRDPDIYADLAPRLRGWRPAFGQAGAAQAHLAKNNVDVGDIFLYFGWFRQVWLDGTSFKYIATAPNIHAIFGWLQIGEVWRLTDGKSNEARSNVRKELLEKYPWIADHPHLASNAQTWRGNTLYIAAEQLHVRGTKLGSLPGAGTFRHFDMKLCLTDPSQDRRTNWRLPDWFAPKPPMRPAMTYHKDLTRWTPINGRRHYIRLQSAGRGQEFVLSADRYPESTHWLADLLLSADPRAS